MNQMSARLDAKWNKDIMNLTATTLKNESVNEEVKKNTRMHYRKLSGKENWVGERKTHETATKREKTHAANINGLNEGSGMSAKRLILIKDCIMNLWSTCTYSTCDASIVAASFSPANHIYMHVKLFVHLHWIIHDIRNRMEWDPKDKE